MSPQEESYILQCCQGGACSSGKIAAYLHANLGGLNYMGTETMIADLVKQGKLEKVCDAQGRVTGYRKK